MAQKEVSASKERVLDAAENLFMTGGYAAIKLKHIAERLGVKESSIYYHFPKGKEELFIAVMYRNFERHRVGIAQAIADAGDNWIAQLRAVCHWLISQQAIDVIRLHKSDLPALDPIAALAIEDAAYESIQKPIAEILRNAHQAGSANVVDTELTAGMFIAMTGAIDIIKSSWNARSKQEMIDILLDSWVDGLRRE